jgi:cell division transport system permease protein
MGLPYPFKVATQSILHEKWIYLLSILTIAAGLLFTSLTLVSVYNVNIASKKLPEKFSVMLYLKDNLTKEDLENIIDTIRKDNAVKTVKYISKDKALEELKSMLTDTELVFEGLDNNPLYDSIEVKLKSEAISPMTVKKLTTKLRELKGIDDIEYGEKFLSSIYSVKEGVERIGIAFIVIMSVGMVFVCYSTVKILFYRKNREIETCKLLGATKGFIRAPFIIEGAVVGLAGGLLGLAGILSLYYVFILRLSSTIPLFSEIVFPINLSLYLLPAGLLIGMIGAIIAIGRIRY